MSKSQSQRLEICQSCHNKPQWWCNTDTTVVELLLPPWLIQLLLRNKFLQSEINFNFNPILEELSVAEPGLKKSCEKLNPTHMKAEADPVTHIICSSDWLNLINILWLLGKQFPPPHIDAIIHSFFIFSVLWSFFLSFYPKSFPYFCCLNVCPTLQCIDAIIHSSFIFSQCFLTICSFFPKPNLY